MDNNQNRIKTSKRNFIFALILLLLTNTFMGLTLMGIYKKTLRDQISQRMLDVANTASAMLNGDELKTITPDDTGRNTEIYKSAYNILDKYKDNIDLEYIYALYPLDDGNFTFSIDPDEESPAPFGTLIELTPALTNAANGIPDVDKEPHSDKWGRFYSAYSPFFDSEGNVVGIVGVDFNAEWYDDNLNTHRAVTAILTMIALTIGIILSFIIMSQNRRNFMKMLEGIHELDTQTQQLDNLIMKSSIKKLDLLPESQNTVLKTLASGETLNKTPHNEYDEINSSIQSVCDKLKRYMKYIEKSVYIDDITGVNNKASYTKTILKTDKLIAEGGCEFAVGFFDINELKRIYTHIGYEAGDELMFECAKLLKKVFKKENVFHVTGDEFIVIIEKTSKYGMETYFEEFNKNIEDYNIDKDRDHTLSVAKGFAVYTPDKHKSYRQVFIDAKANCDFDKSLYYKRKKQIL